MKKRGRIVYLVFLLIFIALLIELDNVILLFLDRSEKFIKCEDDYPANSRVYASVAMQFPEGILEPLYFSGWAFCETDGGNDDKTIDVILKNDQNEYSAHADATWRKEVEAQLPERKIASYSCGVEVQASTIGVKDGIYDVYLYVKENEEDYGLIRTGYQIAKTGDNLEEIISTPVDTELPSVSSPLMRRSSKAVVEDDALLIDGWAFIEGMDTYDQEVLVYVKSGDQIQGYSTKESSRVDVYHHFENDDYMYSGFSASIDGAADAEAYAVCVQVGDQLLRSKWISVKTGEELDEPSKEIDALPDLPEEKMITAEEYGDAVADHGISIGSGSEEEVNIDGIDMVKLDGWGVDFCANEPFSAVYAQVGDKLLECEYGMSRPDVVNRYRKDSLLNVGLRLVFPREYLQDGAVDKVSFFAVSADGQCVYRPVIYQFAGTTSMPVDIEAPAAADDQVKWSGTATVEDDALLIDGWAFIEGQETYGQDVLVYVRSGGQVQGYSAREESRPDVAESFENDDYMYSGFTATIDEAADAEAYAVCVQVGDQLLRSKWISVKTGEELDEPSKEIDALPELPEGEMITAEEYGDQIPNGGISIDTDGDGKLSVDESAGVVELNGWAADLNSDEPFSAVYAQVGGRLLACEYQLPREDVAERYQKDSLHNVGLYLAFPREYLQDGAVSEVSFIAVSADGKSIYPPVVYQFAGSFSEPVDTELPAEASALVKHFSETTAEGDALLIDGWCFIEGTDTREQEVLVYVRSGGQVQGYSAKEHDRGDVAEYFENDDYMYSGFTATIDETADAEAYAVCVQAGDQLLRSNWISVATGEELSEDEPAVNLSPEIEALPELPEGEMITAEEYGDQIPNGGISIDTDGDGKLSVDENAGVVELNGWAADLNSDEPFSAVYAQVGGRLLACEYQLPREDVAERYQKDSLHNVGLYLAFPREYLQEGAVSEVSFIAVSADGKSIYPPVVYPIGSGAAPE